MPGRPRPQGSLRTISPLRGGGVVTVNADERIMDYRNDIQNTWVREYKGETPLLGEVLLHLTFWFVRPDSHYKAAAPTLKREARTVLQPGAPMYMKNKPDLDKLVRAVGDALTGFAFYDDKQVVQVHAAKVWGEYDHTLIEVMTMEEHDAES